MRTLKVFLIFIGTLLFLTTCEKDAFLPQEEAEMAFDLNDLSGGTKSITTVSFSAGQTELGNDRNNPYTVSNIEAAYLEVDLTIVDLEATHQYVKFMPQDIEDMTILDEADLLLLDYPWTKEVTKDGNYYHKPIHEEDFPELYTVIEARSEIPNVAYELIDELYLAENRVSILQQAFTRTDNERAFEEIYATSLLCDDDTDIMIILPDDCGGGGPTTTTFINDCGCEIFIEPRRPGGCLRVDDTQLSNANQASTFKGVRRVKVFARNGWFDVEQTITDDNGCWKINRNYSGRANITFRFKNDDRNKIRSEFFDFINTTSAVAVSTGSISGPNFHDIRLNILRRGSFTPTGNSTLDNFIEKLEHEIWAAATVNNAVHEFHDFAAAEGINAPPRLNILMLENQRFGFASMIRQIGEGTFLDAVTDGAINAASTNDTEDFVLTHLGYPLGDILGPIAYPILRAYVGDVTVGVDFLNSDALKKLTYHELGHVSHFTQVGGAYWYDVIEASVADGGHGSPNSANGPFLSLIESWPSHVSNTMLAQNYSDATLVELPSTTFGSWELHLERIHNETFNHVPIGLHHDLIDANTNVFENVFDADFGFSTTIRDNVSGFTNSQLFSKLTFSIRSIEDYRIEVRNDPGSNPVGEIDLLFAEY